MKVGIPLFPQVTALDFVGPVQMLHFARPFGFEVILAAESTALLSCEEGFAVVPNVSFTEWPPLDVLLVPGGAAGMNEALTNAAYLDFLRRHGGDASWVVSVCTGALLLAAAGLLDDYEAITHWAWLDCLRKFPRVRVPNNAYVRYHRDRNRLTGGGISSGLDATLFLIRETGGPVAAGVSQLVNQYAPAPPRTTACR